MVGKGCDFFCLPAFPRTAGGSLLSWPLAEARKASDNSLSAAWRWIPSHLLQNLQEQLLAWGLPIPKSQPGQRCHDKIPRRLKARQIFEFRMSLFPDGSFLSLKGQHKLFLVEIFSFVCRTHQLFQMAVRLRAVQSTNFFKTRGKKSQ